MFKLKKILNASGSNVPETVTHMSNDKINIKYGCIYYCTSSGLATAPEEGKKAVPLISLEDRPKGSPRKMINMFYVTPDMVFEVIVCGDVYDVYEGKQVKFNTESGYIDTVTSTEGSDALIVGDEDVYSTARAYVKILL